MTTVTDSKGHTYTQQRVSNRDPGAAAAGATVAIYTAVATTGLVNGNTITVNFSPNTTSKAMYVWKVSAASTEFPKFLTSGGATGNTANPTVTTSSITSGDAVIAALASESNVTPTADTDTTNGSWAGHTNATANTGTAGTSMNVHTGYKITTGTGTQTWNQTLVANDWASAYIIIDAAARIDRTATGSGVGSDSDAHLVTRLRTATGSGAGTESATGSIVTIVDRTATGAGTGSQATIFTVSRLRSADGSGVGTSGTVTLHNNIRSATGTGGASTGDNATPLVSRLRTATGSGVGSGTASYSITAGGISRTATGAGAGSESASRLIIRFRTATGSGSSGFDSTGVVIRARAASSSGIGSATAAGLKITARTATAAGVGSSTAVGGKITIRAASGFGEGGSSVRGSRVVVIVLKPRKDVVASRLYPTGRKHTAVQPLLPPRGRWN